MYNKAILIGRLTADPELRTTPGGVSVCTFRIAVNRPYTSGGERKTDFINITAWRQTAEFVNRFFSKGRAIGIDGTIQTRDYVDKDGVKRNTFEIVAEKVFFIEPKPSSDNTTQIEDTSSNEGVAFSNGSASDFQVLSGEEDLPF